LGNDVQLVILNSVRRFQTQLTVCN